jgi:hypothetical protein
MTAGAGRQLSASLLSLKFASKMLCHPERVPACRDESKDLHFRGFDF